MAAGEAPDGTAAERQDPAEDVAPDWGDLIAARDALRAAAAKLERAPETIIEMLDGVRSWVGGALETAERAEFTEAEREAIRERMQRPIADEPYPDQR